MKDVIGVEFMCVHDDASIMAQRLKYLEGEEQFEFEYVTRMNIGFSGQVYRIYANMSTEAVTFVKLSDAWLNERMRTLSISDELKDRYRKL